MYYVGQWSTPTISGQRPPPTDAFTLNKLPNNDKRGIMFGGGNGTTDTHYNDIYVIELTKDTVVS